MEACGYLPHGNNKCGSHRLRWACAQPWSLFAPALHVGATRHSGQARLCECDPESHQCTARVMA